MRVYLDTSSLIKLYHSEKGTAELDKIFEDNQVQIVFLSSIAKIEFNSAIWKKVRTKDLTEKVAIDLIDSFQSDYSNYTFIEIDDDLVLSARELVVKYGIKGLRTLDSIQLASILKVRMNIDLAITADDLLRSLIELEEINTK